MLVATGGIEETVEDYLITTTGVTGDSVAWNYADYEVQINYAWPTGAPRSIFEKGILGLIVRAGSYSSAGGFSLASQCYIARIDVENGKCEIVRRSSGNDLVLADATLPSTATSKSERHTMTFQCKGSTSVELMLSIDGFQVVAHTDPSTSRLTAGDSGIICGNGTVFVDNYAVLAYGDSLGYTGATPSDIFDATPNATNTFMRLWLKTDAGLTVSGSNVTGWQNQASAISGASDYILGSGDSQSTQLPTVLSNALNGFNAVRFDHTQTQFLRGPRNNSLFDYSSSTYGGGFAVFYVLRFYKNPIGQPQNSTSGADLDIAPILNYGRSYQMTLKWNPDITNNYQKQHQIFNNSNFAETAATGAEQFDIDEWVILGMVEGTSTASDKTRGFFKNGNQVTTSNTGPSNFDMSDTNTRLHIGRKPPQVTSESHAYGSFDVVEMIMTEHDSTAGGGFPLAKREEIEGYFAWKWNLVSLLPAAHPYKSAPPTP